MSTSSFNDNLNQFLESWGQELGFSRWGATPLESPFSLEFYKTWIEQNYYGEMEYLKRHLAQKENPKLLNSELTSAIVFAFSYTPHPKPQASHPKSLRTALYSQGEDYHFWLKENLEKMAARLRDKFPAEVFLTYTDSAPILERDLGYRSQLGWVGKNTCLIHPQEGSFFLIGEILTSLKVSTSLEPIQDFCGNCTRCLDICPTQALEAPRLLNAQKCISYLTIESRQIPSPELRSPVGDWFFGCDLCQTVCPWNEKAFKRNFSFQALKPLEKSLKRELTVSERESLVQELRGILTLSGKKLQKMFETSPLQRAGPFGLRRNAILVAANQNLFELASDIQAWSKDEKLKPLVIWALTQFNPPADAEC